MMPQWNWIALGALASLVVYQQVRMYRARSLSKQREELFQIVTENANDPNVPIAAALLPYNG